MSSIEVVYEIRIQGILDAQRADWFPGMSIHSLPEGDSFPRCNRCTRC